MNDWVKLIGEESKLGVYTKVAPTKGNITYEYNPFYNYRILLNMYEYSNNLYTLAELWTNFKITLNCKVTKNANGYNITTEAVTNSDILETARLIVEASNNYYDRYTLENALKKIEITKWYGVPKTHTNPVLREAGELTDFITDELQFDLEHPVHMIPQYSYDGSVNLILNDGKNTPKLINTRFSATGKNTYEVCDRKGNNDTNIYDLGEAFTIDTSLYKCTSNIVKVKFNDVLFGGNLKVGNYHFYFKLADADGNESDFVAESGLVSVFIGKDTYLSVTTGERDLNSYKQVSFLLSNIDTSYDYVHVYYSRYSAENNLNRVILYIKVDKNYTINNANIASITVTGFEPTIEISAEDINLLFNVVDSAYTSTVCQNRLFMANVHKPDIDYVELLDLSLRIYPYLGVEDYEADVNENYSISTINKGYIDPKYIYEKTGYWKGELYRLGIVYILPDNTLTPVFNIRGGCNISEYNNELYTYIPIYDKQGNRILISSNENTYQLLKDDYLEENNSESNIEKCLFENVKGVCHFNRNVDDNNKVFYLDIRIPYEVLLELKKYVKGYFFVRQPRIPLVLAQGITIGINKESNTPTIPTKEGIVTEIFNTDLEKTHVCVNKDSNEVVYASEGFLSRYKFKFAPKSSSLWGKIGKMVGIAVAVVVAAAATIYTCGAAGPLMAALGSAIGGATGVLGTAAGVGTAVVGALSGAIGATASMLIVSSAAVAAGLAGAVAVGTAVVGAILTTGYIILRIGGKTYNRWNTVVPSGYKIEELPESRLLTNNYLDRVILTSADLNDVSGIICPDFEIDLPHFNSIFVGNEHMVESSTTNNANYTNEGIGDNYFTNYGRHFYIPNYKSTNYINRKNVKLISITDDLKLGALENFKFRARAGEAEEAFRIESVGDSFKSSLAKREGVDDEETLDNRNINSDIIRGSFGPYLGMCNSDNTFKAAEIVNIYTPGYDHTLLEKQVYLRCVDNTTFYTISDRFELKDNISLIANLVNTSEILHSIFRGDCYICLFTHRVNRNFLTPALPFDNEIIDPKTWKDHYKADDATLLDEINLADVNAVQLGTWVTFKLRSSNNLNIRTEDYSNSSEVAMTLLPRSYFPKQPMDPDGIRKVPDSNVFNAGFKKLLSEKYSFEVPDVPWIKNWFKTRIMYSDINVSDSFQNNFRTFRGQNYRDYTREYGEIVKIVSLNSNILCVFEHGIALIPVNERAVAGEGAGGLAYINTANVLPDNPKILSDVYGSQWADSILKVPSMFGDSILYVYGVDTVAKKIWRTDGQTVHCISDFKVQEFLNNNITLSLRELTPKLGIRNVKTFYNSFKRDVLFTFYDNTYGFEEKVWNLCWNELMEKFVTFYSWVPSNMENINNIPFSFNRNTTKWIAKLGTSHTDSSFADGITLNNVIVRNTLDDKGEYSKYYSDDYNVFYNYEKLDGTYATLTGEVAKESREGLIGVLNLSNRIIPYLGGVPKITYHIERDIRNLLEYFIIKPINITGKNASNNTFKLPTDAKYSGLTVTLYGLYLKSEYTPQVLFSELYYRNSKGNYYSDPDSLHKLSIGENKTEYFKECLINNYPIYKNGLGKRETLEEPYNKESIVTLLNIKAKIEYSFNTNTNLSDSYYNILAGYASGTTLIDAGYYESTIAIIPQWNMQFLSTDFWKHGLAGIIDISDNIFPTYWYGEQHPFEFEFIVADEPGKHKIFDNLLIISNNAEPESFHYEIIGDCYDFANLKKNMYIRQEATKELYQKNGVDIVYNPDYKSLEEDPLTELSYTKSTMLPFYYTRKDTINEIYDSYIKKYITYNPERSLGLAGAEIVLYKTLLEFRIRNHVEAIPITDPLYGRLKGNMLYKEDVWDIQIAPINIVLEDEDVWKTKKVPIVLNEEFLPSDLEQLEVPSSLEDRPVISWDKYKQTEAKIKDKFLKIRVRYSGKKLAIINAINTLYSISFA